MKNKIFKDAANGNLYRIVMCVFDIWYVEISRSHFRARMYAKQHRITHEEFAAKLAANEYIYVPNKKRWSTILKELVSVQVKINHPIILSSILILISTYSCTFKSKQQIVPDSGAATTLTYHAIPKRATLKDTAIIQIVWHTDKGFTLHTFIKTDERQQSYGLSNFIGNYTTFYPYENTITGSFAYIKEHKIKEYKKALYFFANKQKIEAAIGDSIILLTDIKP